VPPHRLRQPAGAARAGTQFDPRVVEAFLAEYGARREAQLRLEATIQSSGSALQSMP
jgi:HD-GYP domain-containing protein (c-di-GMP phosphodiesterase class II)